MTNWSFQIWMNAARKLFDEVILGLIINIKVANNLRPEEKKYLLKKQLIKCQCACYFHARNPVTVRNVQIIRGIFWFVPLEHVNRLRVREKTLHQNEINIWPTEIKRFLLLAERTIGTVSLQFTKKKFTF